MIVSAGDLGNHTWEIEQNLAKVLHHQVIFLTIDRLESLDEAIVSRVSVGLEYPDLNRKDRKQWTEVLRMIKIEVIPVQNNSLETANTITYDLLKRVLDMMEEFKSKAKKSEEFKSTTKTSEESLSSDNVG
jgi:hypothetical protein